ncbi:hypothetical protein [Aliagarivorans taiwanensis]|uniref:hypothetical protein n=1 Tax=Aliagarivorans taiwanensis TaxID=561966 RepID=UPI0004176016|nr:hypothetical protein [Aliagarivorans taiwanensis]
MKKPSIFSLLVLVYLLGFVVYHGFWKESDAAKQSAVLEQAKPAVPSPDSDSFTGQAAAETAPSHSSEQTSEPSPEPAPANESPDEDDVTNFGVGRANVAIVNLIQSRSVALDRNLKSNIFMVAERFDITNGEVLEYSATADSSCLLERASDMLLVVAGDNETMHLLYSCQWDFHGASLGLSNAGKEVVADMLSEQRYRQLAEQVMVIPTEAGIDFYLAFDGSRYVLLRPEEVP